MARRARKDFWATKGTDNAISLGTCKRITGTKILTGTSDAAHKQHHDLLPAAQSELPVAVERRQVSDLGTLGGDGHGRRDGREPRLGGERKLARAHPRRPAAVGGVLFVVIEAAFGLVVVLGRRRRKVEVAALEPDLAQGELRRQAGEHGFL